MGRHATIFKELMRLNEFQIKDSKKFEEVVLQITSKLKHAGLHISKMRYIRDFVFDNYELFLGQAKDADPKDILENFHEYVVKQTVSIPKVDESFASKILREATGRKEINVASLPPVLYHVTTNLPAVQSSGVLRAQSGMENKGLGGTESVGVSLVPDLETAKAIRDELRTISRCNQIKSLEQAEQFLQTLDDERRAIVEGEFRLRVSALKEQPNTAMLMGLRTSRNSFKLNHKPYNGMVIFFESNINMPEKHIGIVKVSSKNITSSVIEGVDRHYKEVRVLGDIPL